MPNALDVLLLLMPNVLNDQQKVQELVPSIVVVDDAVVGVGQDVQEVLIQFLVALHRGQPDRLDDFFVIFRLFECYWEVAQRQFPQISDRALHRQV